MYRFLLLLILSSLFFSSCGSSKEKQTLQKAIQLEEKSLLTKEAAIKWDAQKAAKLIEQYQNYATKFPDDSISPDYLFKCAEMLIAGGKYLEANQIYDQIDRQYPKYEKAPVSLFLKGFNEENNLRDLVKARKTYMDFLAKYPTHKLHDDAQLCLQNLGKSADEIVKEFEKKQQAPK